MRVKTLEIRWHDGKPITTCDFQPNASLLRHQRNGKGKDTQPVSYRLATGGEDNNVRIWMVHPNIPAPGTEPTQPPRVEYLSTLSKHSAAVNVVRFSPNGELIASAGDDGMIIIWTPTDRPQPAFGVESSSEEAQYAKEHWRARTSIRCTTAEVYDLAWSPTGEYIVAGSTDNATRVFTTADGACVSEIAEHAHYVQGVAWDPLNEFFATQSSDRAVHIYSVSAKGGHFEAHAVSRNTRMHVRHARTPSRSRGSDAESAAGDDPPMPPPRGASSRRSSFSGSQTGAPSPRASPAPPLPAIRPWVKLYGDESHTNFYRRLTFSPDGALLLTPAGHVEDPAVVPGRQQSPVTPTESPCSVLVYTRSNFTRPPVAQLPGFKKATVAVRFSPALYELRAHAHNSSSSTNTAPAADTEPATVHIGKETDTAMDVDLVGPSSSSSADARPIAPLPTPSDTPAPTPAPPPVFALPYRMLYAVASMDTVAVYDTQQAAPVALLARLHYDEFTDLAWSPDGRALMLAARDGYCTLAVFDERVPLHQTQQHALQLQSIAAHSFGSQPPPLVSPPISLTGLVLSPERDGHSQRGVKRAASASPSRPAAAVDPPAAAAPAAKTDAETESERAAPPTKKRRAALTHHGSDTT